MKCVSETGSMSILLLYMNVLISRARCCRPFEFQAAIFRVSVFYFLLSTFVISCSMTVICWVCCLSTAFCLLIILVSISVFFMDCLSSSLISAVSLILLLWYWLCVCVVWLVT